MNRRTFQGETSFFSFRWKWTQPVPVSFGIVRDKEEKTRSLVYTLCSHWSHRAIMTPYTHWNQAEKKKLLSETSWQMAHSWSHKSRRSWEFLRVRRCLLFYGGNPCQLGERLDFISSAVGDSCPIGSRGVFLYLFCPLCVTFNLKSADNWRALSPRCLAKLAISPRYHVSNTADRSQSRFKLMSESLDPWVNSDPFPLQTKARC